MAPRTAQLETPAAPTTEGVRAIEELWRMVWREGMVDPVRALRLMATPGATETDDPRTRLLLRDMMRALVARWGRGALRARMRLLGVPLTLFDMIDDPDDDSRGFSTLQERAMDVTDPDAVLAMLRDMGRRVGRAATLVIGGSIVLILEGLIVHATQDVYVVGEVPEPIRSDHELLRELVERHRLQLTHFQSHYLPDGWRSRVRSLGQFGKIDVKLVEPIDMLVCKLFSNRAKDFRHVKETWNLIDRDALRDRVARSTGGFRRDERTLEAGRHNWYVMTGEDDLPPMVAGEPDHG